MMKKIYTLLTGLLLSVNAMGQQAEQPAAVKPFSHLDLGVTLGSTGLGFDLAAPISRVVTVRTGFEFMPHFERSMHFDVQSFDDQGNLLESKFDRMSSMMKELTGYHVDGTIDLKGKPTMWNFKLLVDVYPFRNKHWHITAGFHWGPSKIAEAYNITEDSPSLFAVGMYNHIYDVAYKDFVELIPTPLFGDQSLDPALEQKIVNMGRMGIRVGDYSHDITDEQGNVIHRAGEPYRMEPDENSMVKANAYANSFKPYLGFGYEGRLLKNDDRYKIGFDAGLMFWGGKPDIITHDGTNLSRDVENMNGNVGRYVDIISAFRVFPVINLRITRKIF